MAFFKKIFEGKPLKRIEIKLVLLNLGLELQERVE